MQIPSQLCRLRAFVRRAGGLNRLGPVNSARLACWSSQDLWLGGARSYHKNFFKGDRKRCLSMRLLCRNAITTRTMHTEISKTLFNRIRELRTKAKKSVCMQLLTYSCNLVRTKRTLKTSCSSLDIIKVDKV